MLGVPTARLPKVMLAGEMFVAGAVPLPERLTACGLPMALSVMLIDALRPPAAAGLKVTLMTQLAPAATLDPQLLVWVKSPGFVPETAMLLTVKAALPVLLRVTD